MHLFLTVLLASYIPGVLAGEILELQLQLQRATANAHYVKMRDLLDQGANPDGAAPKVLPPIFIAVYRNDPAAISILKSAGANIEVKLMQGSAAGATPLVDAICRWDALDAALRLVELGADVREEIPGCTGLISLLAFDASRRKLLPAVEADWKENGIDVEHALSKKRKASFRLLDAMINKGMDVNHIPTGPGLRWSALAVAVEHEDVFLVEYLLQHGADPNKPSMSGTPRHVLRLVMHLDDKNVAEDMLRLLLRYGADPRLEAEPGTLLTQSCLRNPSLVPILLEAGANPSAAETYMRNRLGRELDLDRCGSY